MVRRVVDQHQMRQVAVGKMQPRVVEVAPDIAVEQQERLLAEQRQGAEDSATGFQRFTLRGIGDPPAQARTVAEIGLDLLAKPGMVDHPVVDSGLAQRQQLTLDQWHAGGLDQRLGRVQGGRPHALATPGGEDHRLHASAPCGSEASSSPSSASSGRRATAVSR